MIGPETSLPKGWCWASIQDVTVPRVKQAEPEDGPLVPYIDISSIDNGRKRIVDAKEVSRASAPTRARQWVQQGDVLVSMTRPNLNAVALVPEQLDRAVASTGFDVLRAEAVVPEWLFYTVQTNRFVDALCRRIQGVVYPAVRPSDVRSFNVPIPPLPEQHRIVNAIESYFTRLDDTQASLDRVKAKLKRYRASVLKAAAEGRLVPPEAELARQEGRTYEPASVLLERILKDRRRRWEDAELARLTAAGKMPRDDRWKAKYQEPAAPDTTNLPSLPEGWCWALLPQLGELNRGKSKHRPRNDPRLLGGPYPFVQTGEVREADGYVERYGSTYSEFGLQQSRLWPAGTLCITIAANIAATGILRFDACFPDSVVGFLSPEHPILVRFVEFFIRTARERLEQYAPATAQKNINLETLSALAVPLPPEGEQVRIVEAVDRVLSVIRDGDSIASHNTVRCRRLRRATLQWAFEGKLVDQDPTDEPASTLLERIKAERHVVTSEANGGQHRSRKMRSA